MADIYVDVGPMDYSKDPTKVAAKYATKAKQVMRDAAAKAIRGAAGFTPDKVGNPTGFHFDATLTEIAFGTYQGQPSVTCKVTGVLATYPKKEAFGFNVNVYFPLAPVLRSKFVSISVAACRKA